MLKVKPFKQSTGYCGPASLKMILHYYGVDQSEADLAKLTHCTEDWGVEADILVQVAGQFGFKGVIQDYSSLEDIKHWVIDRQIPIIVDWFSEDDGHYSVVVDIDNENIYFQDPEFGRLRAMTLEKFYRVWFDFPGNFIKDKHHLTIRRLIAIYPKNQTSIFHPSPVSRT